MSPANLRELRARLSSLEDAVADLIDEIEEAARSAGYEHGQNEGYDIGVKDGYADGQRAVEQVVK